MRSLDRAQRKLFADFLEKFALALATAVSAKIFFAEEEMTLLTLCAAVVMLISFVLSLFLAHGTEDKPKDDVMRTEVKKGVFHIGTAEIKTHPSPPVSREGVLNSRNELNE